MAGMPIVGDIASSHRWVADRKPHADHLSVDSLRSRAWEFRSKVLKAIKRAPLTEHSPKVWEATWEATLEDVAEGAAVGPFFEESEVSEFVGDDHWIPTQRFEVVQKNKVRGVDSATSNGINMATVVTEKLELPSTDANVAVIKWLRSRLPDKVLRGWVLDERRAYRQVPISPGHRKWSAVALKDPSTGKVAFFVMVGHSFGLVSAVYNYNRRSAAITDILRRVFSVAAFNFYDDKYGFEPEDTAASAFALAEKVHWWLGARPHDPGGYVRPRAVSPEDQEVSEEGALRRDLHDPRARRAFVLVRLGSYGASSCSALPSSGGRSGGPSSGRCPIDSIPAGRWIHL